MKKNADFQLAPMAGLIGARVLGLDLAHPVPQETFARLRQALTDYSVLAFIGQSHITPQEQIEFAAMWGPLHIMPAGHIDGHKELIEIASRGGVAPSERPDTIKDDAAKLARTDIWHTDMSWEEKPPLGSLLMAREIPAYGGDTMFASQYAAYDTLSDGMKRMLGGLRAIHSGEGYYKVMKLDPANAPLTPHPVIRTNPINGRKALYVNRVWTKNFEGMTEEESAPLLNYLYEHACSPPFTCRHRWAVGDLVLWDNGYVQHYAIRDYGSQTRVMHRATIHGENVV